MKYYYYLFFSSFILLSYWIKFQSFLLVFISFLYWYVYFHCFVEIQNVFQQENYDSLVVNEDFEFMNLILSLLFLIFEFFYPYLVSIFPFQSFICLFHNFFNYDLYDMYYFSMWSLSFMIIFFILLVISIL